VSSQVDYPSIWWLVIDAPQALGLPEQAGPCLYCVKKGNRPVHDKDPSQTVVLADSISVAVMRLER
jgi:hypothetical protein